jgi:hypothetical protein
VLYDDCAGEGQEWYQDKADFESADLVSVTVGAETPGINLVVPGM